MSTVHECVHSTIIEQAYVMCSACSVLAQYILVYIMCSASRYVCVLHNVRVRFQLWTTNVCYGLSQCVLCMYRLFKSYSDALFFVQKYE